MNLKETMNFTAENSAEQLNFFQTVKPGYSADKIVCAHANSSNSSYFLQQRRIQQDDLKESELLLKNLREQQKQFLQNACQIQQQYSFKEGVQQNYQQSFCNGSIHNTNVQNYQPEELFSSVIDLNNSSSSNMSKIPQKLLEKTDSFKIVEERNNMTTIMPYKTPQNQERCANLSTSTPSLSPTSKVIKKINRRDAADRFPKTSSFSNDTQQKQQQAHQEVQSSSLNLSKKASSVDLIPQEITSSILISEIPRLHSYNIGKNSVMIVGEMQSLLNVDTHSNGFQYNQAVNSSENSVTNIKQEFLGQDLESCFPLTKHDSNANIPEAQLFSVTNNAEILEEQGSCIGHQSPEKEPTTIDISSDLYASKLTGREDSLQQTQSPNEDEDDEYVDVVGDGKTGSTFTKAQRQAHIEFYRKLKTLRNRGKFIDCKLCLSKVACVDVSISSHLYQHCSTVLFVCKLCQRGFQDRNLIFEHFNREHPNRNGCFIEDRRDMTFLSELLSKCFPKNVKATPIDKPSRTKPNK